MCEYYAPGCCTYRICTFSYSWAPLRHERSVASFDTMLGHQVVAFALVALADMLAFALADMLADMLAEMLAFALVALEFVPSAAQSLLAAALAALAFVLFHSLSLEFPFLL